MKQCPACGGRNQRTNIFCPMCGHSFLDDEEKHSSLLTATAGVSSSRRKTFVVVAVVVVIILGLAAGLTSFFVSREIDQSSLVRVKTGVTWRCVKCGRIYKNRVTTVSVPKSEKADFGVDAVDGLCFTCKYGVLVGGYQDAYEYLGKRGFFHGYAVDIPDSAAVFVAANPTLFPTADAAAATAVAQQVDPRLVERDFDEYAGKPITFNALVSGCTVLKMPDGSKVSYVQLQPTGDKGPLDLEFLSVYGGAAPVLKGDHVTCCLLPTDVVTYHSGQGDRRAVLGIALYISPASGT